MVAPTEMALHLMVARLLPLDGEVLLGPGPALLQPVEGLPVALTELVQPPAALLAGSLGEADAELPLPFSRSRDEPQGRAPQEDELPPAVEVVLELPLPAGR